MKKRHTNSTFSLSFLDIMCCGFGATVLLVMLLHGQTLQKREETHKDLKAEVERETKLKEFASAHLAELREQGEAIELEEGDSLGAGGPDSRERLAKNSRKMNSQNKRPSSGKKR